MRLSAEQRAASATITRGGTVAKFPIPDAQHARLALAFLNRSDLTPEEKAKVVRRARAVLNKHMAKKMRESLIMHVLRDGKDVLIHRYPEGTPGGKGGQFAPKGGGGSSLPSSGDELAKLAKLVSELGSAIDAQRERREGKPAAPSTAERNAKIDKLMAQGRVIGSMDRERGVAIPTTTPKQGSRQHRAEQADLRKAAAKAAGGTGGGEGKTGLGKAASAQDIAKTRAHWRSVEHGQDIEKFTAKRGEVYNRAQAALVWTKSHKPAQELWDSEQFDRRLTNTEKDPAARAELLAKMDAAFRAADLRSPVGAKGEVNKWWRPAPWNAMDMWEWIRQGPLQSEKPISAEQKTKVDIARIVPGDPEQTDVGRASVVRAVAQAHADAMQTVDPKKPATERTASKFTTIEVEEKRRVQVSAMPERYENVVITRKKIVPTGMVDDAVAVSQNKGITAYQEEVKAALGHTESFGAPEQVSSAMRKARMKAYDRVGADPIAREKIKELHGTLVRDMESALGLIRARGRQENPGAAKAYQVKGQATQPDLRSEFPRVNLDVADAASAVEQVRQDYTAKTKGTGAGIHWKGYAPEPVVVERVGPQSRGVASLPEARKRAPVVRRMVVAFVKNEQAIDALRAKWAAADHTDAVKAAKFREELDRREKRRVAMIERLGKEQPQDRIAVQDLQSRLLAELNMRPSQVDQAAVRKTIGQLERKRKAKKATHAQRKEYTQQIVSLRRTLDNQERLFNADTGRIQQILDMLKGVGYDQPMTPAQIKARVLTLKAERRTTTDETRLRQISAEIEDLVKRLART